MRVLLDTSAYSALAEGRSDVASLVRQSDEVLVSAIVLGELLYGFEHGNRRDENREWLRTFLGAPATSVLAVSEETADRYARIAAGLRRKGKPIPTNDIWIAAHTMESGAILVTYDGHFAAVDGLVWERLGA